MHAFVVRGTAGLGWAACEVLVEVVLQQFCYDDGIAILEGEVETIKLQYVWIMSETRTSQAVCNSTSQALTNEPKYKMDNIYTSMWLS